MSTLSKDAIRDMLKNGIATVTFTKTDGSTRVMKCTLQPELLPVRTLTESKKTRKQNPDVMPVFDVEQDAWRSFRIDSVTSITGGAENE